MIERPTRAPLLNPPQAAPVKDKSKLRFNWLRLFEDFCEHPKWRVVSLKTGVELPRVTAVVTKLLTTASKARPVRGNIGNLDFDECAAATGVPLEEVAQVVKCLNEMGWIDQEWIVDWPDRQPDKEDVTSTERQRIKRAKDRAKKALAMGVATPAQRELVSRVTAAPNEPREEPRQDLILVRPESTKPDDVEAARAANERVARFWLLGDGSAADYGYASKIVCDYLGQRRLSADMTVRRWLEEIGDDDVVNLAEIIAETDKQALNARGFENMVNQRIAALKKLKTHRTEPTLPLGVGFVKK